MNLKPQETAAWSGEPGMVAYRQRPSSTLPDPTVTGPCQAQATFMCTGQAGGERLNPLAMLPGSTVSPDYVPMCQPCYDSLADEYVAARHSTANESCSCQPHSIFGHQDGCRYVGCGR